MLKDNNDSKLQTSDPNEITYESMKKIENDEDIFGPFDSVEELMEALNSQIILFASIRKALVLLRALIVY